MALRVRALAPEFAIARLMPGEPLPSWADGGSVTMVTRTPDELSVLIEAERVPDGIRCERAWCGFVIEGPLAFTLTGILASVLHPLAHAAVPVLAMSTFDTDYVFVKRADREHAIDVLAGAGHVVLPAA